MPADAHIVVQHWSVAADDAEVDHADDADVEPVAPTPAFGIAHRHYVDSC